MTHTVGLTVESNRTNRLESIFGVNLIQSKLFSGESECTTLSAETLRIEIYRSVAWFYMQKHSFPAFDQNNPIHWPLMTGM